MALADRPLSDVLRDIIGNVQEIVRSEVRLAKIEIGEEAGKAKSSAATFALGAVAGVLAAAFSLIAVVYGLAFVMPFWAAALSVGVTLSVIAAVLLRNAIEGFKQISYSPHRTVETTKENVKWVKRPVN